MTTFKPISIADLTAHISQDALDRAIGKSKKAKSAVKKAKRKVRKAAKAQTIQEIRVLLGMARVAIDKAETIARLGL